MFPLVFHVSCVVAVDAALWRFHGYTTRATSAFSMLKKAIDFVEGSRHYGKKFIGRRASFAVNFE